MPLSAYQIVATLGPASQDPGTWTQMAAAGASAFRLNTSHLTLEQLEAWLERYLAFSRDAKSSPPLVLDLQGSKWRLGSFSPFELIPGETVRLVHAGETTLPGELPVPHPDFFAAVATSKGEVVLNDARVRLEIAAIQDGAITARVKLGGPVQANKGITLPDSPYRVEQLNVKDQAILERTRGLEWVRYAISYVRDSEEMARYRKLFGTSAYMIAKLERQPALDDVSCVEARSNELWLCRGDLGAELGLPAMAAAAHEFSSQVAQLSIPALLAGQVLEHMTHSQTPTRSEVSCIYDALLQGYSGLVLSDETAIGKYPVEAVKAAAMFRG